MKLIHNRNSLLGVTETGMTTLEQGELVYTDSLAKYVDWLHMTDQYAFGASLSWPAGHHHGTTGEK